MPSGSLLIRLAGSSPTFNILLLSVVVYSHLGDAKRLGFTDTQMPPKGSARTQAKLSDFFGSISGHSAAAEQAPRVPPARVQRWRLRRHPKQAPSHVPLEMFNTTEPFALYFSALVVGEPLVLPNRVDQN